MYSVVYEWVIGQYTGPKAKYVQSMADAGVGYQILERPEDGNSHLVVAFKRPMSDFLPDSLERVTDERLIERLEHRSM